MKSIEVSTHDKLDGWYQIEVLEGDQLLDLIYTKDLEHALNLAFNWWSPK